ncbi:MAG: TrkH family potassium uptake protein [Methanomicrobiaceae archaeon]|nr:TrkH family potassium uptake protein [Methanomicrobiaceae archaeon]
MYELVSPVRLDVLLKHLSKILIGTGFVLLIPLLVALFYGEIIVSGIYFLIVGLIIISGYLINKALPNSELEKKEALVLAAVIFPFLALICTLPMALLTDMTLIDAFFETVSGITTTGLSVSPTDPGPVFLFTRSWLQWIGGIGILVIAMMIFVNPGTSAYRFYSVNTGENKIKPTVFATTKILIKIYLIITTIAFALLFLGGMNIFDAVCHALSSVSTGGFSTNTNSISGFTSPFIPLIVTVCCVLGALNFSLYSRIPKDIKSIFSDIQTRYFLLFGILGFVLLFFTLSGSNSVEDTISIAFFQAFSAITTSGFSTIDPATLPDSSKAVLTALMWAGGSMGSTAGGIKIIRIIILLKIVHIIFIRFFLPKEVLTPLKIGDEIVDSDTVYTIITYIFLYFIVTAVSCFIFMLHGFALDNSLFEVSSAIGTVGLSCGITDAAMPFILKIVLIADMLLGRIEIIPLFILLFTRTWVKR